MIYDYTIISAAILIIHVAKTMSVPLQQSPILSKDTLKDLVVK